MPYYQAHDLFHYYILSGFFTYTVNFRKTHFMCLLRWSCHFNILLKQHGITHWFVYILYILVCSYMYECFYVGTWSLAHMKVRGWCWISPSVTLQIVLWDCVSYWTWSSQCSKLWNLPVSLTILGIKCTGASNRFHHLMNLVLGWCPFLLNTLIYLLLQAENFYVIYTDILVRDADVLFSVLIMFLSGFSH